MSRIKPILFNADDIRATLDGRKSVKRIVIKPQPTYSTHDGFSWKGAAYGTELPPTIKGAAYNFRCACPYQPGDILYVRETWGVYNRNWWESDYFMYRADYPDGATTYEFDNHICDLPKWRPSIHMPKEAARIYLKVTDVRVERLQDITEDQAKAEGFEPIMSTKDSPFYTPWQGAPVENFKYLWNSTIKKKDLPLYSWNANPWVWVIEFEQCEKPEEV